MIATLRTSLDNSGDSDNAGRTHAIDRRELTNRRAIMLGRMLGGEGSWISSWCARAILWQRPLT